ncbi:MAG: sigma-54 dependent transcriptional regulator [Treponema sp.]|jgi:two-component system nitrogen regulation response regulator NtrX|nr:sigma-54 dependent transcriptional regulator [Treponema sp.]
MAAILIIDDEPGIRSTLASILEDEKYRVFTAEDAPTGLELLNTEPIDLVFLDVLLPKMGGLEALERIHSDWPGMEIVMISGHANIDMAVRAVKGGAFDFLEKPLSLEKVLTVCRNVFAMRKLREENRNLKKRAFRLRDEIVGTSAAMCGVRDMIEQAASSDTRIMITGENGVGKEVAAHSIHLGSTRANGPFVEVNCAAIPETLIESELFGHEKGAFTDAISSRKGRFEMANGGTLFLDEIGDMSLSAQAKVLRVIQEQKIQRLGGEKTIETDVRIVAATNQDLEKACAEGRFRRDLYFRLNVIPIHIPPLRERTEDIPLLLCHFLKGMDREQLVLEDDALRFLAAYEWPGNVREVKNLAERIAVMHRGTSIDGHALTELLSKKPGSSRQEHGGPDSRKASPPPPEGIMERNFNDAKESFEKYYLEFQFSKNDGIISKTAQAIGVYPSNLHAKLKKYNITAQEKRDEL